MTLRNKFGPAAFVNKPTHDAENAHGVKAYNLEPFGKLYSMLRAALINDTYYKGWESVIDGFRETVSGVSLEELLGALLAVSNNRLDCSRDAVAFAFTYLVYNTANASDELKGHILKSTTKILSNGNLFSKYILMVRSGCFGSPNINGWKLRVAKQWLYDTPVEKQVNAISGSEPPFDIILRLVRPTPKDKLQESLWGWVQGKRSLSADLPDSLVIKHAIETTKAKFHDPETYAKLRIQDIFAMVKPIKDDSCLEVDTSRIPLAAWDFIIPRFTGYQILHNLRGMANRGLFNHQHLVDLVARKIRHLTGVDKLKVFSAMMALSADPLPYTSAKNRKGINDAIGTAFYSAAELDIDDKKTLIVVDISPSMFAPLKVAQGSKESQLSSLDVASMFTAALAYNCDNGNDSLHVWVVAETLGSIYGPDAPEQNAGFFQQSPIAISRGLRELGRRTLGTDLRLPFQKMESSKLYDYERIILLSDCETNSVESYHGYVHNPSEIQSRWAEYKKHNPHCKLVMMDCSPNTTTQVKPGKDVHYAYGSNQYTLEGMVAAITTQVPQEVAFQLLTKAELSKLKSGS